MNYSVCMLCCGIRLLYFSLSVSLFVGRRLLDFLFSFDFGLFILYLHFILFHSFLPFCAHRQNWSIGSMCASECV